MVIGSEQEKSVNNNNMPNTSFRVILGSIGLGVGSSTDKFVEKRLPKRPGFERRVFFHKTFYGLTGYAIGNYLDNITGPSK